MKHYSKVYKFTSMEALNDLLRRDATYLDLRTLSVVKETDPGTYGEVYYATLYGRHNDEPREGVEL